MALTSDKSAPASMPPRMASVSHPDWCRICPVAVVSSHGPRAGSTCSHALGVVSNTPVSVTFQPGCACLQTWDRQVKSSSRASSLKVPRHSRYSSSERCVPFCLACASYLGGRCWHEHGVLAQVNPSRKADDGWTSCKYRGAIPLWRMLHAWACLKMEGCILCHGFDGGRHAPMLRASTVTLMQPPAF